MGPAAQRPRGGLKVKTWSGDVNSQSSETHSWQSGQLGQKPERGTKLDLFRSHSRAPWLRVEEEGGGGRGGARAESSQRFWCGCTWELDTVRSVCGAGWLMDMGWKEGNEGGGSMVTGLAHFYF